MSLCIICGQKKAYPILNSYYSEIKDDFQRFLTKDEIMEYDLKDDIKISKKCFGKFLYK